MKMCSPFKPWESNYGRLFYDDTIAAGIESATYAASNVVSWNYAKKMPKLQAEANERVIRLQKEHYDHITDVQRRKLNNAIGNYVSNVYSLLNGGQYEDAYSTVPVAAEYVPVDIGAEHNLTKDLTHLLVHSVSDHVNWVNRLHEQNDLQHALSMDPRFMVELDVQSQSILDLMRGVLSTGDVLEVIGDASEQAAMLGRIGNTRKVTARDLGVSQLRAKTAGRKEFREATAWANSSVSPISRQGNIWDRIDTVNQTITQRFQIAIQQSQIIQQSLQNKNNALAVKAPYKMAKLQAQVSLFITQLQSKMNEALLTNNFAPNYASTVTPSLDNVAGLVGAIGQPIAQAAGMHFFGKPGQQEGYVGGRTSPAQDTGGTRRLPDASNK